MITATDGGEDLNDSADNGNKSKQSTKSIGIIEAKQAVIDAADELIDHPVESVIKLNKTSDMDYRGVVEVVEREAVPDTQDMIGRYEFTVDQSGTLTGYNLVERYHRGDSKDEL